MAAKPVERFSLRFLKFLEFLDLTRHPLRYVMIVLILVVLTGTFGVIFFLAEPGSTGDLREDYVTREAYTFRKLELNGLYISLVFDSGGAIIPVYSSGQVTAAVITGKATLTIEPSPRAAQEFADLVGRSGATNLIDTVNGCYLPATYQGLEEIKDSAAAEVSHAYGIHLPAAQAIIDEVRRNPNLVMVFGQTRQFTEGAPVSAYFCTEHHGGVTFLEGNAVTLAVSLPVRRRLTFANELPFRSPFSPTTVQTPVISGPLLAFGAVSFLLVALTYVLTIDLIHPRPQPRYRRGRVPHPRSWDWAFLGTTLFLDVIMRLLVNMAGLRAEAVVLFHVAGIAAIIYWLEYVGMNLSTYLGLTRRNIGRVVFVGASLGILATIGGAVSFPSGFRAVRFIAVVWQVIWSFGFIGLVRAVYYHGFVQTTFERHLGRWWGWLGAAFTMAVVYFLPGFIPAPGNPVTWPSSIIGGLVTLTLTFAVIGFLFHRTRSAWGAAVTLGLLDFLPKILTF